MIMYIKIIRLILCNLYDVGSYANFVTAHIINLFLISYNSNNICNTCYITIINNTILTLFLTTIRLPN